jgi:hypothetical protein
MAISFTSDRPIAPITLPKLKCLELPPHPNNDADPLPYNGVHAAPRQHHFVYEPKDGREELRVALPSPNKYGTYLLPPRVVGPGQHADMVFTRGRVIALGEDRADLLMFIRGHVGRFFRLARYHELNEE